jgi:hypothetical protein
MSRFVVWYATHAIIANAATEATKPVTILFSTVVFI